MEPMTAPTSEYLPLIVWGGIALIWLVLTIAALWMMMRSAGWVRLLAFLVSAAMVWVLAVPVFASLMLFLLTLGSTAIEGPVGAAGPVLISGSVLAAIFSIILCLALNRRRKGRP